MLTIELQGVIAEKFEVSNEGKFRFAGRGAYRDARENVRDFALELDLLKPLNASDPSCGGLCDNWRLHPRSKTCKLPEGAQDRPWEKCTLGSESYNVTHCEVTARDVQCVLIKKTREPYWGHLLKDNERPSYMHVDWSRWLDEDKDGVRWNEQIDRAWEWWKHDDAEDEDEENEEQRAAREQQEQKQRERCALRCTALRRNPPTACAQPAQCTCAHEAARPSLLRQPVASTTRCVDCEWHGLCFLASPWQFCSQ